MLQTNKDQMHLMGGRMKQQLFTRGHCRGRNRLAKLQSYLIKKVYGNSDKIEHSTMTITRGVAEIVVTIPSLWKWMSYMIIIIVNQSVPIELYSEQTPQYTVY
jgi:hypothetical protein